MKNQTRSFVNAPVTAEHWTGYPQALIFGLRPAREGGVPQEKLMRTSASDRAPRATIIVRAERDDDAGVWVASSDDVHGLSVECETLEGLREKVIAALLDLIELNGLEYDLPEIPVHIMAEQLSLLPNPSCN